MNIISRWSYALLFLPIIVGSVELSAQLSPGELAQVHAHLEGVANCTKCHTLGEKVENSKCLDCHERIDGLINAGRGLHANPTVRTQDCFACHSDHHGRKFDMVRFNEKEFDHMLTGYELTGAHATVDCRACHQPDFIDDDELSRRSETFLGLSTECVACHQDYHRGSLGNTCVDCHNTEAFRPASGFDHDDAQFPLTGAHNDVDCAECHSMIADATGEYQQFSGLEFNSCAGCHDDVHEGRLGADCAGCHQETGFNALRPGVRFDHGRTDFPLEGSHNRIDCRSCHDVQVEVSSVFADFNHIDVVNCNNCHEDVHDGRFGFDCASCHNVNSFLDVAIDEGFNHAMTDFPLVGMHVDLECARCHTARMTDPIEHAQCMDCHDDHHEGQMSTPECSRCHEESGFANVMFDFTDHAETEFALDGAHMATPCLECHLDNESWIFTGLSTSCVECHVDIHESELDPRFYPNRDCESCHSTVAWYEVSFDHSVTEFVLDGRHETGRCAGCHLADDEIVFTGLPMKCRECHEDVHGGQFDGDLTTCGACHFPSGWQDLVFEHDSTRFPLEGAHALLGCTECHQEEQEAQGVSYVVYRNTPYACAACHDE